MNNENTPYGAALDLTIWWRAWDSVSFLFCLSVSVALCLPFPLSSHPTSLGEAARVWRCISRWEEQRSPPSHSGHAGRPGRLGHAGHLQHAGHCAPHLPAWLHPHLASLTWWRPPHDLSDPGVAACNPRVAPCYPGDADDPHDARISGGDEDGASAPGIHTPQPI